MKPDAAKKGMTMQTLIFDKGSYKTAKAAKSWARQHGFKSDSVDETTDSFRLRQRDPKDFADDSFRTITLKDGIKAVVGKLKTAKASAMAQAERVFCQYADDLIQYACNYLCQAATTVLRTTDDAELKELCSQAIVCATVCTSHFAYWDESSLAARIGAVNELSACCELLIEALEGKDSPDLILAAQACYSQCFLTAGTEVEEESGPAHPEPENEEVTPAPATASVSKAKAKGAKPRHQDWDYEFNVSVRNEVDMDYAEMAVRGLIGYSNEDDSGTSSKAFLEAYAKVPHDKEIKLHVDSEGGAVQDSLVMYNTLKKHGAKVTTINDGYALSAATIVMLAGAERISPVSSSWMIHRPRAGVYGDEEDLQEAIDMLASTRNMMAAIYAEAMDITRDEAQAIMSKTTWYDGEQALAAGLATQLEEDEPEQDDDHQEGDEEDDDQEARASGNARLFRAVALYGATPPERIISSRLKASGLRSKPAGLAASTQETENNMNPQDTKKAALETPAASTNFEARFNEERKARITNEVGRRAEGKLKNDQLDWWVNQAVDAKDLATEQAVYAQLDAMPKLALPGGDALPGDAAGAADSVTARGAVAVAAPRFEFKPLPGINARPDKRLPWMAEIQRNKSPQARATALKQDWAGRVNYCIEQDMKVHGGTLPQASNTYSATLITDFLEATAVTILVNRWASLKAFTLDFEPDRVKEYSTAQVKFVTSAGTTQRGTKSSPITNFESGDGVIVPLSVPMTHYVKSFNTSQEDMMSGLRIENLVTRNLGQFADDLVSDALTPLAANTAGYASFQIPGPQSSAGNLCNYAGTVHINSGTFGWNAGQTDGHDLATIWGYLKKSPVKNLILDGNFYGRLVNSPGYFQPAFDDERGNGDRAKTYGWDVLEENTKWPNVVDGAGNAVGGFGCANQAILAVLGLPQTPPNIPGATLQETVVSLPGPDISISMYSWFNLSARKIWNSFEVMGGFCGGDMSAGIVIYNGSGPTTYNAI